MKGALEVHDLFGSALASGDFDADGYADLAVGIPGEDIGSIRWAGAVQVLYGGPRGLTARDQVWHQGKRGVPGDNERDDSFGGSLAVGDFDGDGYADLAIGAPKEGVGSAVYAGAVVVVRGSAAGLTSSGAKSFTQGAGGIPSQPSAGEYFGFDMAAGDVTGDGCDDLIVQVVNEVDVSNESANLGGWHGGAFHLLVGSPSGLTAERGQYFGMSTLGLSPELVVRGMTVADINRDGLDDLSFYAAKEIGDPEPEIVVLHGHSGGFNIVASPTPGTPGADAHWPISSADYRGYGSIAAGDITGDGFADLAFTQGTGVGVFLGSVGGLVPPARLWSGVPSDLGMAVLTLSGGTHGWLVSGSGGYGTVRVLQGTGTGDAGSLTLWHQDSPGIKGVREPADGFGVVTGSSHIR